ncbi:MAG: hypothetical protein FJ385_02600 [Verrucomicrobia bacterium]|nr:hypothetical protein [Verrucomicrobiota bacterium]
MKTLWCRPQSKWLVLSGLALVLCSCSTLNQTLTSKSGDAWRGMQRLLPGGNRVPVVEVREKDLKELPSGSDLAKLQERRRYGSFWMFGGPADFRESELPPPGTMIEDGLLPPLDLH